MGAVRNSRGCRVLRFSISFLSALALPSVHAQTNVAGFTPGGFQVSERGAAIYTVPIQVPPGIAGMEPKLALTYNSQGGNGLLGTGWSLGGLMTIHRCGRTIVQDGNNAATSYNANDRYCLDGQRLVMISPAPAVYGTAGTEYRTERESFTKIVAFGAVGTGPAYFKAWTKSGQVMEFGNADVLPANNSRITAQGKTDVRVYAVNKISDTKGNYLTFTYTQDLPNGDYTPSRIDYTGNSAASVAPFASVQFSYDTTRTDVSSSYIGGSLIKTQSRLTNVKTFVGATAVRDYRLAYTYSPNGPSQVTSVTECTGDGLSCLPAHSFTWQAGTGSNVLAGPVNWGAPYYPNAYPVLGDINGDGLADMVYATAAATGSPTIVVQFSNGNGFGPPVVVGSADAEFDPSTGSWYPSGIEVADFNGDGRADVRTSSGSVGVGNVRLSNGNSLAAPVNWGVPAYLSSWPLWGDINGDGFPDMVYTTDAATGSPTIVVQFSTGSGLGGPVIVGSADATPDPAGGWIFKAIAVVDVNGDGRADVMTLDFSNQTGINNVRLSTGNSLAAPVSWASGPYFFNGTGVLFADINGDGLADAVYGSDDNFTCPTGLPCLVVRFSNGNGFGGPVVVGQADAQPDPVNGGYSLTPIAAVDLNGDGRADVMTVGYRTLDGTNPYPGAGNVRLAQTRTPDLITAFTNSLGVSTTIPTTPVPGYKPLTDSTVYTKDANAVWPVRDMQAQGPMYVVASVSQPNGVGGSYVMNYKYTGAKMHMTGGGFLGFRMFEATDPQTGIKTATSFRQDYPFQGLPTSVVKTQSSGALINQVTNGWTLNPAYNALPYTYTSGKYHRPDLTSMVESSNDVNGAAFPTVTTTTAYDAYGNPQNIAVSTGDGYSKMTANTYINDTANWFLGRLTKSTVTSTTP